MVMYSRSEPSLRTRPPKPYARTFRVIGLGAKTHAMAPWQQNEAAGTGKAQQSPQLPGQLPGQPPRRGPTKERSTQPSDLLQIFFSGRPGMWQQPWLNIMKLPAGGRYFSYHQQTGGNGFARYTSVKRTNNEYGLNEHTLAATF